MKQQKILARGAAWVLLVRENTSDYERSIVGTAKCAEDLHKLLRERICREQVEVMYAVGLDGKHRIIALCEVARGGIHSCAVSVRDCIRPMVAAGATAFILVHNHPSGDPTPSAEDIAMTRVVEKAAAAVGTPLVDHIVIASWERFSSLLDLGLMEGV